MTFDELKAVAQAIPSGDEEGWYVLDGVRVSVTLPCEPVEDCGYDSVCIALTHPDRRFDHKAVASYIAAVNPATVMRLLRVVDAAQKFDALSTVDAKTTEWMNAITDAHDALRLALRELDRASPASGSAGGEGN